MILSGWNFGKGVETGLFSSPLSVENDDYRILTWNVCARKCLWSDCAWQDWENLEKLLAGVQCSSWVWLRVPPGRLKHVYNVMAHAQKPDLVFKRSGWVYLNWRGGGSVFSTTDNQGVRLSSSNGSNAGYTTFWGTAQDYWLPTPLSCFPSTSPTELHRVPSSFNWALPHTIVHCAITQTVAYIQ